MRRFLLLLLAGMMTAYLCGLPCGLSHVATTTACSIHAPSLGLGLTYGGGGEGTGTVWVCALLSLAYPAAKHDVFFVRRHEEHPKHTTPTTQVGHHTHGHIIGRNACSGHFRKKMPAPISSATDFLFFSLHPKDRLKQRTHSTGAPAPNSTSTGSSRHCGSTAAATSPAVPAPAAPPPPPTANGPGKCGQAEAHPQGRGGILSCLEPGWFGRE